MRIQLKGNQIKNLVYGFSSSLILLAIFLLIEFPINERKAYEQLLLTHPYSISTSELLNDEGLEKKYDHPDLAMMQDFLWTMDPVLLRPTPEVLNDANAQMAQMRDYGAGKSIGTDNFRSMATSISQSVN